MSRMIYMLCLAAILVGCTIGKEELGTSPLETSLAPTMIGETITTAEETNNPTETTNDLAPQYIDESKYEGDELGVVKTLNIMMKAFYDQDINTYNSLITGDMNPIKSKSGFKKVFLSTDKLDFTVKPTFAPPDGAIPVWIEYTESVYNQEPEPDSQLFVFQFEDDIWKLLYITDHWKW